MESSEWDNQKTVKLQRVMLPWAHAVYRKIFPGCIIEDLRVDGTKVNVLDQEFGIDCKIHFPAPCHGFLTVQEKFRSHNDLSRFGDFTQEWMNAAGTARESQGEWFKLAAQLYFYGWSNATGDGFAKWLMLDVAKYRILVAKAGGLLRLAQPPRLMHNNAHGRATFYGIPLWQLRDAALYSSHDNIGGMQIAA